MHRNFHRQKSQNLSPWRIASAGALCGLLFLGQTAPLLANPSGGVVVAGAAMIGPAGATLTINQSTQNAIINWQQFSIAGGQATKFIVPTSGATLNRVTGGNPSAIYGSLSSNGTLYLVNPNGIVVGPSGRIDTAGFLASTLDVSNQQFLKGGALEFTGSSAAAINNAGVIHASSGDVYLLASQVSNTGTLAAAQGTVGLAAGNDILFQPAGDQHLFVQATAAGTKRAVGVTNSGTIRAAAAELKAAGGNAYALAINNSGVIAATGYRKVNGQVYLTSDGGSMTNRGRISARTATGNGGRIVVEGTALKSATSGQVINAGTLDASATVAKGKGGAITVRNMGGATIDSGGILSLGGQGGAGGSVEISGRTVGFTGTVNLSARNGTTGTLLLDPATLEVVTGGTGVILQGENDTTSTTIDPVAVEVALSTASVTLNADTNITITNGITWTSANTLTLSTNTTGSTITINAPVSGTNGTLTIAAAASTDQITTGANGAINVSSFLLQNGEWNQVSASLPGFTASTNFAITGSSTFIRAAGGNGTSATPYQITDIYGLQGIGSSSESLLANDFNLANDIDASGTASWNGGAGFASIGSESEGFTGTFNGLNHTVDGLFINSPSGSEIGLFGYAPQGSTIENLGVTNANVTGFNYQGILVGFNQGDITSCYTSGVINGVGEFDTGGLVGLSWGVITSCYSVATVHGTSYTGGLVGYNFDGEPGTTISNCYSTGSVSSTQGSTYVGGLVGNNSGTVATSYTTGTVSPGSGGLDLGAFIGLNTGTTTDNFFDTDTEGTAVTSGVGSDSTANSPGVTGATTAQLKMQSFYPPSWMFGTVWTTNGDTTLPQIIGVAAVEGMNFVTAYLTGVVNKIYDGGLNALNLTYALTGVQPGDTVTVTGPNTGTYATKDVGSEILVTSDTGLVLSGADADKYTLTNTQAMGDVGTITPATLTGTLTGTVSKTFDGTTDATLAPANILLSGFVGGDSFAASGTGTFDSAAVGTGKTVTPVSISLSGPNAQDYQLSPVPPAPIGTITAAGAPDDSNPMTTLPVQLKTSDVVPVAVANPNIPVVLPVTLSASTVDAPPPISTSGAGISGLAGQTSGDLAGSTSTSSEVGKSDSVEVGGGGVGNSSNSHASGALGLALGPVVYQNLSDALKDLGDWADVPAGPDTAGGDGSDETILNGGDVAEVGGGGVKNIPLSQAPDQLRNAMNSTALRGVGR